MSSNSKILIIEDDPMIRELIGEYLVMAGYSVHTAGNGAEALEYLEAEDVSPSLILLDLNMPVMSGKTFLEKLRAGAAAHAKTPVLLMTAVPDDDIGCISGCLVKPFKLKSILEQVEKVLGLNATGASARIFQAKEQG